MGSIDVYIADWEVLFREGMHFILSSEDDIEVVGESVSNEEAFGFIESNPPNVVILAINDRKPSGIDITQRIKRKLLSVSVILIINVESEEQLFLAMKSGASACVNRGIGPNDLVKMIRDVDSGAKPIDKELLRPTIASRVLKEFEDLSFGEQWEKDLLIQLTPGEADILRRISEGAPGEQLIGTLNVAAEIFSSPLNRILHKLTINDQRRQFINLVEGRLQVIPQKVSETPEATLIPPKLRANLIDFFRARGYKVAESTKVTGKSGAVHTLDILATIDDAIVKHVVAVGILAANQGETEVAIDEVTNFDTKADDIGVNDKIIIAIPKLGAEAQKFAEIRRIKILTVADAIALAKAESGSSL
jgi:two-component system, NarL family, response regulator DevR